MNFLDLSFYGMRTNLPARPAGRVFCSANETTSVSPEAARKRTLSPFTWLNATKFLAAVGIFGVVGPAVGGLVAWTVMGMTDFYSPVPFLLGAYGEGTVLSLGAGILTCGFALQRGTSTWIVPVGAALATTLALLIISVVTDPSRQDLVQSLWRLLWVFLPPSLVAALVSWRLARPLLRNS